MPRGRKPNLANRIAKLIDQLKEALIAQEQSQIVQRVEKQVGDIWQRVRGVVGASNEGGRRRGRPAGARKSGRGNRKPRSAASRRKQAAAMKAYWAKRKAAAAK